MNPTTASSAPSDEFILGFGPMDDVHVEFGQLMDELITAPDDELEPALGRMALHLKRHFSLEEAWMNESQFPPRECHIDEHSAVMKSVTEVQALMARDEEGALVTARALAVALQDWFPGHATHLDSALAHWMCKRQHGGKPIVFRRRLS